MKNIIVYGSRFGQFYLEALKRMKGIKIVGLLAKGSDRSYECARYYNIPPHIIKCFLLKIQGFSTFHISVNKPQL